MDPVDKLRAILDKTGKTQEWVASQLGTTQATVSRWLKGSDPKGSSRDAINDLYEEVYNVSGEIEAVPLVGLVGAGSTATYFAAHDHGELGRVTAPPNATPETVAVQIKGESLGPAFDRWYVYYDEVRSPVTPDMLGTLCVVGLPDDRVLVKQIKPSRSPGLFHLISATEPPILDVEIAWAAKVKHMMPHWLAVTYSGS
jgi:transcriptional regulator with XRE-family HTH domain